MQKSLEQLKAEELTRKLLEREQKLKNYRRAYYQRSKNGGEAQRAMSEALAARKSKLVGINGVFSVHGIDIYIRVLDVKLEHGHECFLIEPITGSGKTWVRKLKPMPTPTPTVDNTPNMTPNTSPVDN